MTDSPSVSDPVYEAVAAFAAGLVADGVTDVVISPGSRSTPLALTFHAQPGLRTWIQLDERSAGFFALGQARRTGRPSVVVCTSGTAAANYLPAVVEAHHAGVPMIVCTADRPPELRDWGAGQTIDQVGLYGTATRWAADLPVAGEWEARRARLAARRAVRAALGTDPGPVHLNWPLREPLEPVAAVPVVAADPGPPPPTRPTNGAVAAGGGAELPDAARGVIVVGPDAVAGLGGQAEVARLALELGARAGWPVIGEPISGVRTSPHPGPTRIAHADHLLRSPADDLTPDLVVRIGGSPTTKPLRLWLERVRPARVVLVDPRGVWNEASFSLTHHIAADPAAVLREAIDTDRVVDPAWAAMWTSADAAAAAVVARTVDDGPLLGAGVARVVADSVPAGTLVMTSNSMAVRELDAFVAATPSGVAFVGNRGASGIDGITSTALGLASRHDGPVVLFTGDLALLHDLGALFGAARAGLRLTVVCVDNDGGGIFSLLPIAAQTDADDFTTLFRTPHGVDLSGFHGVGGVRVTPVADAAELAVELGRATASTEPGVDLLFVTVDRDADVAQQRTVAADVAAAVGEIVR